MEKLLQKLWDEYVLLLKAIDDYCEENDYDERVENLMKSITDNKDMKYLRVELHRAGVKNMPGIT